MDTSGSPVPDAAQPLFEQLREALVLEDKYKAELNLPVSPLSNDDITIGSRDGSAHVLRCLKVWYDLPSDVLFIAINLMDRFLTKMKAKAKHMACISVSSFYIAAVEMSQQSLDPAHLVSISQCKCTTGDLKRMSELIRNKLECPPGTQPITSLVFLRLFNMMFHAAATHLGHGDLYSQLISESELYLRLEMVICDGNCASLRPSEVALALLCTYINYAAENYIQCNESSMSEKSDFHLPTNEQKIAVQHLLNAFMDYGTQLKTLCKISDASFFSTHQSVGTILKKYNGQEQTPYRQRLIWRLSSRTARLLKPTDRFTSVLPVIAEHVPTPTPKKIRKNRKFVRRQGHKMR